jgi:hypothetical protein
MHLRYKGKYQVIMIQILYKNKIMMTNEWREECEKLKISRDVFYRNRNRFLEHELIKIDLGMVTPIVDKVKETFGNYIHD